MIGDKVTAHDVRLPTAAASRRGTWCEGSCGASAFTSVLEPERGACPSITEPEATRAASQLSANLAEASRVVISQQLLSTQQLPLVEMQYHVAPWQAASKHDIARSQYCGGEMPWSRSRVAASLHCLQQVAM